MGGQIMYCRSISQGARQEVQVGNSVIKMNFNAQIVEAIDGIWLDVPSMPVGIVKPTLPTPDRYILISVNGRPERRLDLNFPVDEYNLMIEAIEWGDKIMVGYCGRVSVVDCSEDDVQTIHLLDDQPSSGYFNGFWSTKNALLIVSGIGITSVDLQGKVQWRNNNLGLDGVTIRSVHADIIEGEGVWGPPDDAQRFEVELKTGRLRSA